MLQILRYPQGLSLLRVNGFFKLFKPLIRVQLYGVREQVRIECLKFESVVVQAFGAFGLEVFRILLTQLFRMISTRGLEVNAYGKVLSVV